MEIRKRQVSSSKCKLWCVSLVCVILAIPYLVPVTYSINHMGPYQYAPSDNSVNSSDLWDTLRTSNKPECLNMTSGVPQVRPSYLGGLKNPCWYNRTGQMNCLPYFYIAGFPKCGTSDLYNLVITHPEITKPQHKENQWLTIRRFGETPYEFSENGEDIGWYLSFYKSQATRVTDADTPDANNTITVDASASTFWTNQHWWRFRENCGLSEPKYLAAHYLHYILPKAKIIVIMRNPTERLFSDYIYFNKQELKTRDDFHNRVQVAISIFNSCVASATLRACLYNRTINEMKQVRLFIGMYSVFVEDWMKVFPRQQLFFIRFESYINDRLSTLKSIYKFLKMRPLSGAEEKLILENTRIYNSNAERREATGSMRRDTRKLLDSFYRKYNENLARLLHDDGYLWQ